MSDRKTLDLAREWARRKLLNPVNDEDAVRAALLIQSLPDTIVDGDKLREVIGQMQDSLYVPAFTRHEGEHNSEIRRWKAALEALLPTPPTMAEIEWDDAEHRLAEATVSELSGRPHEKVLMVEIDDFGHIRSLDPTTREMWSLSPGRLTPTGRRYRLEPEEGVSKGGPIEQLKADPAYAYRDRAGDKWSYVAGGWRWGGYLFSRCYSSPPAEYAPYTRIEKENTQ